LYCIGYGGDISLFVCYCLLNTESTLSVVDKNKTLRIPG